ncbi:MAG: ABC transporter ATP-binding protein/permease [Erysipelotrichales bacterium]|nr:ABC transporter ATP-binding protein/permease [Erysipelotrichales bacterium]
MQKNSSVVKYLLRLVWQKSRILYLYFFVFALVVFAFQIALVYLPKLVIDNLLAETFDYLWTTLAVFILITVFCLLIKHFVESRYLFKIHALRYNLIRLFHHTVLNTDYQHFENSDFHNEAHLAYSSLENAGEGYEAVLRRLFLVGVGLISLIGLSFIIIQLQYWIIALLIINALVTFLVIFAIKKIEFRNSQTQANISKPANYYAYVMNEFSHSKDIRLYGMKNFILGKLHAVRNAELNSNKNTLGKSYSINLLNILAIFIREGIIYIYLVYALINNDLPIGDFVLYIMAIASFNFSLENFLNDTAFIKSQGQIIKQTQSFFTAHHNDQEYIVAVPKIIEKIEFRDVFFRYPNEDDWLIEDLSVTFTTEEKIGITGPHGSGKSTFIKLLCGLLQPEQGEILINDINIQDLNKNDLYKLYSSVFQKTNVFAFSLETNISAVKEPDQNKLKNAVEDALLDEKIYALPNGFKENLTKKIYKNGLDLSESEAQRLSISRAFYKDRPIVIFDEPSLDCLEDKQLYNNFVDFTIGKLSIFVSQRVERLQFCDKIAVFEKGEIIEYGSHQELMSKNGQYFKLTALQKNQYEGETDNE